MSIQIRKIARLNDWKNYILPFLLGVIFASVYIYAIPFDTAWRVAGLLMLSITGTAAYGYLLNNIFDLAEDQRSSKSNYTSGMTAWSKTMYAITFLLLALAPWLLLPVAYLNFGLFILQLLLLAAYSIPPFRLKRFVHFGVITDALYNSLIMVFVIVFTIKQYADNTLEKGNQILVILFVVLFLKGLRGILLHQLADRKNDRKTSILTFVNHYGPMRSFKLIWRIIFPLELLLFAFIFVVLSFNYFTGLWIIVPVFILYLFLFLRLWERDRIRNFQFKFSIVYIINDLYEEWLPVVFLGYLAVKDPWYLLVMAMYLLLFNKMLVKWYLNTKQNLRNFNDLYFFLRWKLEICVKRIIN